MARSGAPRKIAPQFDSNRIDHLGASGETPHQQSFLHACQNLHGDVARSLIARAELTSFHTVAHNFLKPLEMHLGEAVQGTLDWRGNSIEHRSKRPTGTHTLTLAVNRAEQVEIGFELLRRLFSGITRGKRLVVLVGQRKAVAIAVRNVFGRRRWSKLDTGG